MARYLATVETPWSVQDAFAYLSDFSNAQEWDPGVPEAERLDGGGPVAVGSAFRLTTEFLGRRSALRYEVVELDAPHLVTFRGENATVTSLDTITFVPRSGGGTVVTYDADLQLKGPLKLADPLLRLAFGHIGGKALAGLRERLAGPVVRA